MIYVAVYALNGLFLPGEYLASFSYVSLHWLQLIVFFWIASDILKDEKIAKKALLAYSIASMILALGLVLSLPGFAVTGEVGVERAEVMGALAFLGVGHGGAARSLAKPFSQASCTKCLDVWFYFSSFASNCVHRLSWWRRYVDGWTFSVSDSVLEEPVENVAVIWSHRYGRPGICSC